MFIVTGANGFIGSQFVSFLNQEGIQNIICVDPVSRDERPQPLAKARFQEMLHSDELPEFLKSRTARDVSWIIHMGAVSSTTETSWQRLLKYNVDYSKDLFAWCAQNEKPLIYASSAATYGGGEKGYDDTTDSELLSPLNLYGKSKVEVDRWATKQSSTPPHWYGLKFFNVYGPHEEHKGEQSSVALKAFHQIRETGRLRLFKSYRPEYRDGEQKRDFIYVKDVCRWMGELMERRPDSGIYNMGYGRAQTWMELAAASFSALGLPPHIEFIDMPESLREHYQYFTEAVMTRWLSQGLSQPKFPLYEGIKDYMQNYLMKNTNARTDG